MASLRPNLVKRIERLPKPTNVAAAMQPLFEAIINSIHSTQSKFKDKVESDGNIIVTVSTDRKKDKVWATIEDNGCGLDDKNWEAFTTTDTDNKIQIGGKGVGRLMWLDCFQHITIESVFEEGAISKLRSFDFVLSMKDQIQKYKLTTCTEAKSTYFNVKFEGLRNNEYFTRFPGRGNFVFQHLTSHFLPTFIGGQCPRMTVQVGDETRHYPSDINKIVQRRGPELPLITKDYGLLNFTLMECDKVASSDLKGSHFGHFIAHDRTVHSHCIDGKLGIKYFGANEDRVFHSILKGE